MEIRTELFIIALHTFCDEMDELINEDFDLFEEDEEDYWDDDVDETNYDPYLGCDFYDTDDCCDW